MDHPAIFFKHAGYLILKSQFYILDDPASMPNTSQQIDAREQFFCVFKRKLVERDFLFAGEMDGIVSDKRVTLLVLYFKYKKANNV